MKKFIAVFITCLVVCYVATFFFAGLIFNNFWAIVTLVAFVLSVFITVIMEQESRIEALEKKVESLLNQKQTL